MPMCASAGTFTNYVQEKFLKHFLNLETWTPPADLFAALGNAASEDGSFTELSGKNYQRQPIRFLEPILDGTQSAVLNKYTIMFGSATADWDSVAQVAIFDAQTGGNLFTWAHLTMFWVVKADQQLVFRPEQISVGLTEGWGPSGISRWSKYLQEKTLRHLLRQCFADQYYSPPSIYAALPYNWPNFDDSGSDLIEPDDPEYGRPQITEWSTPNQSDGYGRSYNERAEHFGTASKTWFGDHEQSSILAYTDAATDGNLLAFADTSIDQSIFSGDSVYLGYGAGYIQWYLK